MTFLYLPALRSVDLARNEISYVYKFAFYRLCSDAARPVAVSLRANRLDADAVWKLLTINQSIKVICNACNVVHKLESEARAVASGRVLMVIEKVGLEASFESIYCA